MLDYIDDFETPSTKTAEMDAALRVHFTKEARLDTAKTEETGQEHYKDVDFVTIIIPADKTLSVHRPVMRSDKIRFAAKWRAFEQNQKEPESGTPLATWPLVSPGQRKELEYLGCRTVEQLALISDAGAQSMMGLISLRQKAERFLKAKENDAGAVKLAAQLAAQDDAIAALKAQVVELAALAEKKGK